MSNSREVSISVDRVPSVATGANFYFEQALLALDAREGVLKSGGAAAGYYDSVPHQ